MSINKSKLTKSIQDRGNYTPIPNDIWSCPISCKAKIIYVYLLSNSDKWNPGIREIANSTGVSTDTVSKSLIELENACMLQIIKPEYRGMRTQYIFSSVLDWKSPTSVHADTVPVSDEDTTEDFMEVSPKQQSAPSSAPKPAFFDVLRDWQKYRSSVNPEASPADFFAGRNLPLSSLTETQIRILKAGK